MNYGALISEAFWLTWRHRFLWFFGFFVGGGFYSFNFNFPTTGPGGPRDGRRDAPSEGVEGLARWITENLILFLVVMISLAVLIALVFIVLSMISQGGLIESVAALRRDETRRFASTWRAGVAYFWSVPMHFNQAFTRGVIDTRPLVLYASVTVFSLFLTVRSLEARRWQ